MLATGDDTRAEHCALSAKNAMTFVLMLAEISKILGVMKPSEQLFDSRRCRAP